MIFSPNLEAARYRTTEVDSSELERSEGSGIVIITIIIKIEGVHT